MKIDICIALFVYIFDNFLIFDQEYLSYIFIIFLNYVIVTIAINYKFIWNLIENSSWIYVSSRNTKNACRKNMQFYKEIYMEKLTFVSFQVRFDNEVIALSRKILVLRRNLCRRCLDTGYSPIKRESRKDLDNAWKMLGKQQSRNRKVSLFLYFSLSRYI